MRSAPFMMMTVIMMMVEIRIVCMTRTISTVYDDDSDFEADFCSIWRLLESILGPFCAHVGALGRLGGQDLKK